jgi:hypothetical protein
VKPIARGHCLNLELDDVSSEKEPTFPGPSRLFSFIYTAFPHLKAPIHETLEGFTPESTRLRNCFKFCDQRLFRTLRIPKRPHRILRTSCPHFDTESLDSSRSLEVGVDLFARVCQRLNRWDPLTFQGPGCTCLVEKLRSKLL